jgi:hypothetical protein
MTYSRSPHEKISGIISQTRRKEGKKVRKIPGRLSQRDIGWVFSFRARGVESRGWNITAVRRGDAVNASS